MHAGSDQRRYLVGGNGPPGPPPTGRSPTLFVANEGIADVQVRSPTQIYIFGKAAGTTTVYATDSSGRVVYSANLRVGQNLGQVGELIDLAMPEADIR